MTGLTEQELTTWRPNPWLLSFVLLVALMLAISALLTANRVAAWFCLGAAVLLASNGLAAAAICWQIDRNRSRSGRRNTEPVGIAPRSGKDVNGGLATPPQGTRY